MKQIFSSGLVVSGLLVVSSCYMRDESPPMAPAAGSGVLTREQAATTLGEARCDREAKCSGIGPSARYATREQCLAELSRDSWNNLANCPYGVKDREVRACMSEIQGQACGGLTGPLDWFTRTVTCQSNNLCLR